MLMSLLKTRRGLGMGRWSNVNAGSNMGKGGFILITNFLIESITNRNQVGRGSCERTSGTG